MAAFWPIGTWQIIRIVSYPIRKKSRFWLLCMWSVKGLYLSSKTQGRSVGREKRRNESFQAQAEKSLGTISKRSSECWLLIGHKKCFVLLCPVGEQHLLSSFREFVHDGYYLATVARFVHQLAFLTRKEGINNESKNVWDTINRSNTICTEKILFLTDHNVS